VLDGELLHQILGKRRDFFVVDILDKSFYFHGGLISCFTPWIGVRMKDCFPGKCYLYFSFAGCPKRPVDNGYEWGKAAMTIHFFFVVRAVDRFSDDDLAKGACKSIEEALNIAKKKNHSDVVKFLEYISPNK
jgi:hypothetical protein